MVISSFSERTWIHIGNRYWVNCSTKNLAESSWIRNGWHFSYLYDLIRMEGMTKVLPKTRKFKYRVGVSGIWVHRTIAS